MGGAAFLPKDRLYTEYRTRMSLLSKFSSLDLRQPKFSSTQIFFNPSLLQPKSSPTQIGLFRETWPRTGTEINVDAKKESTG